MQKLSNLFMATAIFSTAFFSTQAVFADDMSSSCTPIVKACIDGGFVGKKFWDDCMHPALLNKTVQGVKLDAAAVKTCRTDKIAELKKLLKELESV